MKLYFSILLCSIITNIGMAQDMCGGRMSCEKAPLICDLTFFDNKLCQMSATPNTPFPTPTLCFGLGVPHNIAWWSFVGSGGALTLTFNFDAASCESGQGIQAGVFEEDCSGANVWDCNASCNTNTFSLTGLTKELEAYFIYVDGCNGDVCSFEIFLNGNTSTPSIPEIDSLNIPSSICVGNEFTLCVPPNTGSALLRTWTVDGIDVDTDQDCLVTKIDEQKNQGDSVEICLTLTLGDENFASGICDQKTKCQTVVIDVVDSREGPLLEVCYADQPFFWHGELISSSCINPPCTVRAFVMNDCDVDSIRPILLLPPEDSIYIDTFLCNGLPFVLPDGQQIFGITCDSLFFPNSGSDCPSSLFVTIRRPAYSATWSLDTLSDEICFDVMATEVCGSTDTTTFEYILLFKGEHIDTFSSSACFDYLGEGLYSIKIINNNINCDTIIQLDTSIRFSPLFMDIIGQDTLCRGDSVSLSVSTNFDEYEWEFGGKNEALIVKAAGTYCVTGRLINGGNFQRKCIQVHASWVEATPSIIPDNGTNNGAIYLSTRGTGRPFTYQWSSGETTDFIVGKKFGDYAVRVTNQFGCDTLLLLNIPFTTSSKEEENATTQIYPNPTKGTVWISSEAFNEITIYDLNGKSVLMRNQTTSEIDLSNLLDGVYLIKVLFPNGKIHQEILVKHAN